MKIKEKGRKLAVNVAAIKLVRLVILSAVTVLIVAPLQAKMMEADLAPMIAQMKAQPGGGPAAT